MNVVRMIGVSAGAAEPATAHASRKRAKFRSESLHRLDRRGEVGKPEPSGLFERPRSERRDPDRRMRVLHRKGNEPHRVTLVLPADRFPGPRRHHRVERPLETLALLLRGHVERIEEARPVAPADAENHAALGKPIEHRDLFRDLHRMTNGKEVRARSDAKTSGACGHRREGKERLRERNAFVEVELREPERIETERFRPLPLPRELVRAAGEPHVPCRHPDVKPPPIPVAHASAPFRRRHHNPYRGAVPPGHRSGGALYTRCMASLPAPASASAPQSRGRTHAPRPLPPDAPARVGTAVPRPLFDQHLTLRERIERARRARSLARRAAAGIAVRVHPV